MPEPSSNTRFERAYAAVRTVPSGRVTTYGDIAKALTGTARTARTVGWALRGLPPDRAEEVPWWRVVNARGEIRTSSDADGSSEQRRRLMAEGVPFDDQGRIELRLCGWDALDIVASMDDTPPT